jgi:MFS transporter, DHA2 family, multidrug resistance protein
VASGGESLDHRHRRHAGDFHGGARHLHRQRSPAPHRGQPFRGQDESTWVLTSYLVSNAIVLPLSGWLSSIIGRKNFYMSCVALFTVSSFMCGLAPNLTVLIICRVLQGIGGGGLQPSEQAILADTFPPPSAAWLSPSTASPWSRLPRSAQPSAAGSPTTSPGAGFFSSTFPSAFISILLTSRLIQDPPYFKRRKLSETRIDYIGLGFVALGLGTLQVVLDKGQRDDWFESHFIVILSVISALSLIFVIFWEWRTKDPIIDLHLFRDRTFGISNLLMFMLGFALLGSTLLLPLFMQTLLGYSAEQAGLGLDAGRILHHAAAAAGGIFAFALQSALAARFRTWSCLSALLFHMTGF